MGHVGPFVGRGVGRCRHNRSGMSQHLSVHLCQPSQVAEQVGLGVAPRGMEVGWQQASKARRTLQGAWAQGSAWQQTATEGCARCIRCPGPH